MRKCSQAISEQGFSPCGPEEGSCSRHRLYRCDYARFPAWFVSSLTVRQHYLISSLVLHGYTAILTGNPLQHVLAHSDVTYVEADGKDDVDDIDLESEVLTKIL